MWLSRTTFSQLLSILKVSYCFLFPYRGVGEKIYCGMRVCEREKDRDMLSVWGTHSFFLEHFSSPISHWFVLSARYSHLLLLTTMLIYKVYMYDVIITSYHYPNSYQLYRSPFPTTLPCFVTIVHHTLSLSHVTLL